MRQSIEMKIGINPQCEAKFLSKLEWRTVLSYWKEEVVVDVAL